MHLCWVFEGSWQERVALDKAEELRQRESSVTGQASNMAAEFRLSSKGAYCCCFQAICSCTAQAHDGDSRLGGHSNRSLFLNY